MANIADELGLHEFVRTGGDLKEITSKRMQSVRADVLEAVIASIYLDGGLEASQKFITRFWNERLLDTKSARRDSKTALQEWAHANQLGTPRYKEKCRSGPDHDPEITVSVKLPDRKAETGTGRSKRLAEQAAAREFLLREGVLERRADLNMITPENSTRSGFVALLGAPNAGKSTLLNQFGRIKSLNCYSQGANNPRCDAWDRCAQQLPDRVCGYSRHIRATPPS